MPARVIKGTDVRIAAEPRTVGGGGAHGAAPASRGEPRVDVRTEGDTVTAIEVTCPCGNHMVLDCVYDGDSGDDPGGSG